MRSISTAAQALLTSGRAALALLIRVETYAANPPVLLNTSGWDLAYGGETYLGAAGLGSVSAVQDQPGELTGIQFEIAATTSALSLALVDAQNMRGKSCVIRTALIDPDSCQILDAPVEFTGRIDTFRINGQTVQVTAEAAALDLVRPSAYRYTSNDQQVDYPTDKGFDWVVESTVRIVWPAQSWGRK